MDNIKNKLRNFSVIDIETINIGGRQIPVLLSHYNPVTGSKLFVVNYNYLKNSEYEKAIKSLFTKYFKFLIKSKISLVFAHNLGGFDGYFIFKYLFLTSSSFADPKLIKVMIDESNKFIKITQTSEYKRHGVIHTEEMFTFKDSMRLLGGMSLNNLCKIYGVEAKLCSYKQIWNSLDLFKDENKDSYLEWKLYAEQDSKSLYEAIVKAQDVYKERFEVDVTDSVSASQLAYKLFKKSYSPVMLPTILRKDDEFLRRAYFGGAVDYYKASFVRGVKKLFHYDVVSLYPYAMLKTMPISIIERIDKLTTLDNFFGFIECEVKCDPNSVKTPVLPHRLNNKNIYGYGTWTGVYFSEEIRACLKLGYTFKLGKAIRFDQYEIFNKYINEFFKDKASYLKGDPRRDIAKLMLNSLYGYFGRSLDQNQISITDSMEDIGRSIDIDSNFFLNICKDTSTNTGENGSRNINAHVAIASAVTAYARIHMMQFKIMDGVYYTDTDSIFTDRPLPDHLIGKELGMMDNELANNIEINRALFLGNKKYFIEYVNTVTGELTCKSVVAGISKNYLTFDDGLSIFNGDTIVCRKNNVFIHNNSDFTIAILDLNRSVKFNPDKSLIGNSYIPVSL